MVAARGQVSAITNRLFHDPKPGRELLQRPRIAIGVLEAGVEHTAARVLNSAYGHTPAY